MKGLDRSFSTAESCQNCKYRHTSQGITFPGMVRFTHCIHECEPYADILHYQPTQEQLNAASAARKEFNENREVPLDGHCKYWERKRKSKKK